ncbi:hypothetical protein GGX14DRAFT_661632 [Mycena pura]|uniref:HMG box domain-containing protein n=1 Tax=Mycena pura TaxID=153505 RepID=A0AAD6V144_9AGAR|nr:hypothetical protein GGX14DRAFT_661632 [Mycena pura]
MSQVPTPAARLESLATTVTPLPSVAVGAYRVSTSVDVGSALDGPEERRPKRGEEDYVPRPPNPFMLFRSWYCWYWIWRRQPGVNLNEAASREWNAFSPEERAPWAQYAVNNALKTKLATIAPKEQQAVRVQPIEKCKLEEYFGPHSAGLS